MKNFSFKFLFPLLITILILFLADSQFLKLPAVGHFFNPYRGFVQNENSAGKTKNIHISDREVKVVFDKRNIPHIFAKKQEDLLFAQGYITASDRLWQMDFMTYLAAGRLAEILGRDYLEYDRIQRRNGLFAASRRTLTFIESNPITKNALDNYTAGVNAFINQLSEAERPFEYKLLDYKPESWTNLKSVLIMKYMGSTLTGYQEDMGASYLKLALGNADFDKLYPDYSLKSTLNNQIALTSIYDSLPHEDYINYSFLGKAPIINPGSFNPRLGSNAWAVSAKKTTGKKAILCNDPHLNLTLPAVWYELQLNSEEENVYGYSIPGTPGIIIGFNEHIAWGITNGATDVRDWYKLDIKEDYSEYKFDNKWVPTGTLIEEISIKDSKTFFDTIHTTIHGPIVLDKNFTQQTDVMNCASKWVLHENSNEFLSILMFNKAKNNAEFYKAIQEFRFPVLNFLYADTKGNIANYHQGSIYKRKSRGYGKFVYDGNDKSQLATEYLTEEELPQEVNPERGFVYSANNNPFKSKQPYYVNGYYSELRANKIQNYLVQDKLFSIDDMKKMQGDNTNRIAELALPILLPKLENKNNEMAQRLQKWNCSYDSEDEVSVFFEQWWKMIEYTTWDELVRYKNFVKYPDPVVLLNIMVNDSTNKFFDLQYTTQKESLKDIVNLSFNKVLTSYKGTENKLWGDINQITMIHLSNIDPLGKTNIRSGGCPDALNAISKNWGPSLRMIVEMDVKPKAYGVFAGGPSGNPASKNYDSFVDDWLTKKYYELKLYSDFNQAEKEASFIWYINK